MGDEDRHDRAGHLVLHLKDILAPPIRSARSPPRRMLPCKT